MNGDYNFTSPLRISQERIRYHYIDEPEAGKVFEKDYRVLRSHYSDPVLNIADTERANYYLVRRSDPQPSGQGTVIYTDIYASIPTVKDKITTWELNEAVVSGDRYEITITSRGTQPLIPSGATIYGPAPLNGRGSFGTKKIPTKTTILPIFYNETEDKFGPYANLENWDNYPKDIYVWVIKDGDIIQLKNSKTVPATKSWEYFLIGEGGSYETINDVPVASVGEIFRGQTVVSPPTINPYMGNIYVAEYLTVETTKIEKLVNNIY